jgi:hypothetical protein
VLLAVVDEGRYIVEDNVVGREDELVHVQRWLPPLAPLHELPVLGVAPADLPAV